MDAHVEAHHFDVIEALLANKSFNDDITAKMKAAIEDYIQTR